MLGIGGLNLLRRTPDRNTNNSLQAIFPAQEVIICINQPNMESPLQIVHGSLYILFWLGTICLFLSSLSSGWVNMLCKSPTEPAKLIPDSSFGGFGLCTHYGKVTKDCIN